MNNLEISELLRDVAAAYKLNFEEDKNVKFKIIAYERAADAIEHLSSEAKDLWDENKLSNISGIGPSIASHLGEIFETGESKHFKVVLKDIPPQIFTLMKIPGIGPKTAFKLVNEYKISKKNPVSDLEKLAKSGKIRDLESFGEDSEKKILQNIIDYKNRPEERMILPYALKIANEIILYLKENNDVLEAEVLGSARRKAATVGDIDIAVATDKPKEVLEYFTKYKNAKRVLEKGEHTASIIVPPSVQVDLMVQNSDSFGSLLQHFTGSKHHNIALRELALKKKLSLSEYGVKKAGHLKKFSNEKDFYNFLGLDFIPPELREGKGEIEAAKNHALPSLIELSDIKGDLQLHSSFDIETSHDLGESSMSEILKKAESLNYEYIAFTEHNPSHSKHSKKQILEILKRKKDEVDKLNSQKNKVFAFNSLEIDILPDGSLPILDDAMDTLDFALVSIHSSFKLDRNKMTKRVLSALSHPKVKIFAHPTARKINHREGVELAWEEVFEFCLKNDKWIEINAEPMRLDLPDFLVKEALQKGIKLTMGTDAHHKDHMDNMIYGVNVARRGWCEKKDVINTLPLTRLKELVGIK